MTNNLTMQEESKSLMDTHSSTIYRDCEQSDTVRNLREQVHKAFLQINETEKFRLIEAQYSTQQYEESKREWLRKQELYRAQIADLERRLADKQIHLKSGPAILDLGDLDDSYFFDDIQYVRDEVRDSGIQKLQQLLTETERSPACQLEERRNTIKRLSQTIFNETKMVSQSVSFLVSLCNELCLENCTIKEELKNFHDSNDVSKCKIQEAYNLLSRFKQSESRHKLEVDQLREENRLLKTLYESQVNRKQKISNALLMLQEKASQNESENVRLQEIIKDQSSRLGLLNHEQIVLNQNYGINDSNSKGCNSNSDSNISTSTLSSFLQKINKKNQNKEVKPEKLDRKLTMEYRMSHDTQTPTSTFRKKPFLPFRKGQN